MKTKYSLCVFLFILGMAGNAYAWTCNQTCPSSFFSGRAECLAYKAACDPVGTTTGELERWRKDVLSYLDQGLTPPIVREYFTYLEKQGRNNWKRIPSKLKNILIPYFSDIALSNVMYAENINTVHGQAITVDKNIYFPNRINLNNYGDIAWLIHELEHVSQYNAHGGKGPFVVKYLLNGALEMGRNGSIDIHDALNLEKDAENKSNRIIGEVWRKIQSNNPPPPIPGPQISGADVLNNLSLSNSSRHIGNGRWEWTAFIIAPTMNYAEFV